MDPVMLALVVSLICNVLQSLLNIWRCVREERQYHQQQKDRRHLSGLQLEMTEQHPDSLMF